MGETISTLSALVQYLQSGIVGCDRMQRRWSEAQLSRPRLTDRKSLAMVLPVSFAKRGRCVGGSCDIA